MKGLQFVIVFTIYSVFANIATAQEILLEPRAITEIFCHEFDGECGVTLSGEKFGGEFHCPDTEARWNSFDPNGRATLALLISAQMLGRKVRLNIFQCYNEIYDGRPSRPTFNYVVIGDF